MCEGDVCRESLCVAVRCPVGTTCKAGACASPFDSDGDGVPDSLDNCPTVFNPSLDDFDRDLVGDVCDCNPDAGTAYPGASEVCADGLDNDCDGIWDCADADCLLAASCQDAGVDAGTGELSCPPEDGGAGGGSDAGPADSGVRWVVIYGGESTGAFEDLFVAGPSAVWTSGASVGLWNGSAWAKQGGAAGLPLWGTSPTDLWGVARDRVTRWNGAAWTPVRVWPQCTEGPALHAVNGVSTDDVWVVGEFGATCHWNGSSWSFPVSGTPKALRTVWASASSDVWAAGDKGTLLHWNGLSWTSFTSGLSAAHSLSASWGLSSDDVWVGGQDVYGGTPAVLHWNGNAWRVFWGVSGTSFGGTSASDVWASSTAWSQNPTALAYRWNGTSWDAGTVALDAVRSRGSELWAVNGGDLARWNGGEWEVRVQHSVPEDLGRLWSPPTGSVWAVVAPNRVLEWQGGTARIHTLPDPGWPTWARGISGTSDSDVWVVGEDDGTAFQWNGSAWSLAYPSAYVDSVWSLSATSVWFAGAVGQVARWNGNSFEEVRPTDWNPLVDIWAGSATDVWACGSSGRTVHGNGATFATRSIGSTAEWVSVWGSSSTDVWVVGSDNSQAAVAQWNGSAWSLVASPSSEPTLNVVHGSSSSDVWVGDGTALYRWNGTSWTTIPAPRSFTDVWVRNPGEAWVSGYGLLAHTVP